MDKYALLADAGFIHRAFELPLGVHRVADVAIKRITELEAENGRLRDAVGMITYYGLDDCWKAAKDMRAIAKAALEGKDG